jgi:hypothetical protein
MSYFCVKVVFSPNDCAFGSSVILSVAVGVTRKAHQAKAPSAP